MAVKQLPKLSELPEPPDRLVGDQERFDTMTFDSLKAQKKMVNDDLNKGLIPKLNEFAGDVNASVDAAAQSERNAAASATTAGNKATQAAAWVTGKKFHFVSAEIVDSNTRRTLLPGTAAGTYGNGNLINGMATDVTVDGTPSDTAVKRGQIGDAVIVSAVSNLNDYQKSGEWFFNNSAIGTNFPSTAGGFLSVRKGSSYVKQIYRVFNSDQVFQRKFNSAWTVWVDRAATAQTAANNALTVANSKAPDGYGLGTREGRLVLDANEALEAGWYGPKTNQADTINFYEKNHPLLVLPRNTWGTVQIQIVHGKIAVRELWNGAWTEWALASVGYADRTGYADGLGDKGFVDSHIAGTPLWLLGLHSDGKLRPFNKGDIQAGYADSAGYANARFLNAFSFATANTGVTLPAGGSWLVFAQWYSYGGDYWEVSGKQAPWIGYRAGGSRIEEKRLGFALRIS